MNAGEIAYYIEGGLEKPEQALFRPLLTREEAEIVVRSLRSVPPEALRNARFNEIVDDAKREADRRAFQAAITDEDVEKALEAANGAMVDTRRHWTAEDRAAVRAMLEAVSLPSPLRRRLDDGFGNVWELCERPDCGLEIVRPGKVQCGKEGCSFGKGNMGRNNWDGVPLIQAEVHEGFPSSEPQGDADK